MGNYVSCTLSRSLGNNSKGPKVILPDGSVRHLDIPTNAAELMLDAPGFFLVNSRSMHVGRRFSPLCADEDLEMRNVYVMLPMARVNSFVAAADVGRLLMAADNAVRRATGGRARILPHTPLPSPSETLPAVKLDFSEIKDELAGEFSYRLSMCRSRRPTLETIAEEGVCSR